MISDMILTDTSSGMVLFYCTLVAMKRQDQVTIPDGLDDFFQPGEDQEFGGYVLSLLLNSVVLTPLQ